MKILRAVGDAVASVFSGRMASWVLARYDIEPLEDMVGYQVTLQDLVRLPDGGLGTFSVYLWLYQRPLLKRKDDVVVMRMHGCNCGGVEPDIKEAVFRYRNDFDAARRIKAYLRSAQAAFVKVCRETEGE